MPDCGSVFSVRTTPSRGVVCPAFLSSDDPYSQRFPRIAFVSPPFSSRPPRRRHTVDDIVAKNLAAKGGIEKLRAITTVKMTGSIKSPCGVTAITTWAKRPTFMRRENVNDGQTFVTAFDGKTLWQINPLIGPRGPREIPAPPEAEDFDSLLLDYKRQGPHRRTRRDRAGSGHRPCTGCVSLRRTRRSATSILNAETMLESKAVGGRWSRAAARRSSATEFSNYKTIDGISVPMHDPPDGERQAGDRSHLRAIEFNVPIDDGLFSMPK